jgi:hypothetical protein
VSIHPRCNEGTMSRKKQLGHRNSPGLVSIMVLSLKRAV